MYPHRKGGHKKVPWITGKENEESSLRQNYIEKSYGCSPPKALFHALLPGSLTVEAALALPIFLFAMIMILFLFRMMQVQYLVGNSLDQAVAEASLFGGLSQKEAENLAKAMFYKELAVQKCPVSGIELGAAGFSWNSGKGDSDFIDLSVSYRMRFPLNFFGRRSLSFSNSCRMHRWTGNQDGAENREGNEWVYLTPTQNVYHIRRDCSHLKITIQSVTANGTIQKKYQPCGHCVRKKKPGAMVYITSEGDCYHMKIDCSGLKRTVYMVLKEQVKTKRACARCGGK